MNIKILDFIKEMKDLTGECFVFEVTYWQYTSKDSISIEYKLGSSMPGLDYIHKESEAELIDTFDLIREKVNLLLKCKELTKQIEIKRLN